MRGLWAGTISWRWVRGLSADSLIQIVDCVENYNYTHKAFNVRCRVVYGSDPTVGMIYEPRMVQGERCDRAEVLYSQRLMGTSRDYSVVFVEVPRSERIVGR